MRMGKPFLIGPLQLGTRDHINFLLENFYIMGYNIQRMPELKRVHRKYQNGQV